MPSTHKPWTCSHTVTFTIGFILGLVINHYAHSCVTACFWIDLLPGYKHTQLFAGKQKMECGEEFSLVEYFLGSSKPFLRIRHGKKALGSLWIHPFSSIYPIQGWVQLPRGYLTEYIMGRSPVCRATETFLPLKTLCPINLPMVGAQSRICSKQKLPPQIW